MTDLKLTAEQRRLVDEFSEVRARVIAWRPAVNPDAARFAELNQQLVALAANMDPAEATVLKGYRFLVPVSACERKRTIVKIPALFRKLRAKWVAEHCKPTLTAIEKALSKEDLVRYVEESRSGPRSLGEPAAVTSVPKTAAA